MTVTQASLTTLCAVCEGLGLGLCGLCVTLISKWRNAPWGTV